jgi:hypothetical protein
VPSARGADHIYNAAITARNAGSYLVVLASGRTDASAAEALVAGIEHTRKKYLVLDFSTFSSDALLPLRTFEHPLANLTSDLSQKRNVGLILSSIMGWQSVLFVDDDVQPIGRAELRDAAALLAGVDRNGVRRRLVGWACSQFPDFSSVGHARAHGADARASFAGGGAMALSCDPVPPFFPPVYNEDMLVWLEMLRRDPTSVSLVGTVTQEEYNPFGELQRAADQEFGEVLVEGMIRTPSSDQAIRPEFWRQVLRDRRAMLQQLSDRLEGLGVPAGVLVVQVALDKHTDDWPGLLADFIAGWDRDLAVWRDTLTGVPRVDQLGRAAAIFAHLPGGHSRISIRSADDSGA